MFGDLLEGAGIKMFFFGGDNETEPTSLVFTRGARSKKAPFGAQKQIPKGNTTGTTGSRGLKD